MPVKFKISEMFDNSCELFENEMQHKNIESEKRIKEIVFLEIGHTKAKRNRRRYQFIVILIFECPMIYCKSFGFMFLLASLVQNVWRSVCGVICGKGLSLWCLLYFSTIRTKSIL